MNGSGDNLIIDKYKSAERMRYFFLMAVAC